MAMHHIWRFLEMTDIFTYHSVTCLMQPTALDKSSKQCHLPHFLNYTQALSNKKLRCCRNTVYTVCPEKSEPPPNILHWQVQTCPVLNKTKHALAQTYLSYCRQISYDSIIPFNRFSIFTNCCHRFQLPTLLAYYARRTLLTSRVTSFCW